TVIFMKSYRFKFYISCNKMPELIRRNFTKTFKPGDFGICSKAPYCLCFFLFTITIECLTLIPYPKQWRFQYIQMTLSYKIRKKLKKKCNQQQSDMHAVNVGISCYNNIFISQ